jgi:hypothetical protein
MEANQEAKRTNNPVVEGSSLPPLSPETLQANENIVSCLEHTLAVNGGRHDEFERFS